MFRFKRRKLLPSFIIACGIAAACADPDATEDTEQSSAALVPACGANLAQVDGIWAKSNGAYMNTGTPCAGSTPVGALAFQCVEYAQRYMNAKFGIAALWPVDYARQMCTQYPAGVTPHAPRSGYVPKHGDLLVWGSSWGGGYGHVAVIDKVSGGTLTVVEQNAIVNGSMGVRNTPLDAWDIECYVSANANTDPSGGGGTSSGSGNCALGDGLYCGTNGAGTDPSKLYRCAGGVATVAETCALGCEWRPDGENDRCRTDATCPYGAGLYCGSNGISGASNVLFECGGGKIVPKQRCASGCDARAVGENDRCL
jgi:hypothetical protein